MPVQFIPPVDSAPLHLCPITRRSPRTRVCAQQAAASRRPPQHGSELRGGPAGTAPAAPRGRRGGVSRASREGGAWRARALRAGAGRPSRVADYLISDGTQSRRP